MSLLEVCQWINDTAPATALRESDIAFPIVESIHVLAITLMAGTVSVVDLRLLGIVLKREPVSQVAEQVLPFPKNDLRGARRRALGLRLHQIGTSHRYLTQ